MKRVTKFLALAAVAGIVSHGLAAKAQETLTYPKLVKRLTNLEYLSTLPARGDAVALWSSYDRASKYDAKNGKYINWDANGDGQGIIRREGDASVVAEMGGPGCIWRTWSAAAEQGHVKIFLDGQETPVLDMPFADYFNGKTAPFAYPMLSYNLGKLGSAGQNLYFPIPYQKSCKIVAEKGWGNYYQFTYETFPKGTKVPTFSKELAAENTAILQQVNDFFQSKLGTDPVGKRDEEKTESRTVRVAPGKTAKIVELAGPQAITAIRVKIGLKDRNDQEAALRKLALSITWDGEAKPAVWCPLGDFFGTAPGENFYQSLTTGMTKVGYYAYWYMPFAKSAVVELNNDDTAAREIRFEIVHASLGRPFEGLGYFHAKWHRDTITLPKDRWPDWVMLKTGGRGRFCGVHLHVWNPWGTWWGEGDDKFFVDGEKFPSSFGTGSEDYFGYAWCCPSLFQRPYHGQNVTQGNKGNQSVFRWHIADNAPFQNSFEGCIEKYYGNEDHHTLYACTVFWYLAPGGVDPYDAIDVDQRYGYNTYANAKVAGFAILDAPPPGSPIVQSRGITVGGKFMEVDQLWWIDTRPGDKLNLGFDVEKAGRYDVAALLTKANDYGIVQLYLDGRKTGGLIDLYCRDLVVTDPPAPLGVHELAAGQHKLTVEIVGSNEKAKNRTLFGLIRLVLEPAK